MRGLLDSFTTRGTSFLAAGVAAGLAGLIIGDGALVSVAALLVALPLLAALAAGRARYRLSCGRTITPARVSAGHTATVTLRLENISRLPTGLLLAEDTVPYALGTRPRFVLDGIERGGARELSYPLRSDLRGKFAVGPLEIRIADTFGLVEVGRSFSSNTAFLVTPKVVPLASSVIGGTWVGEGDGRSRAVAAAGEDDVTPRAYQDGDELRRVHWRSTARYGELMVRREEQRWRSRTTLLLDTRRSAHAGTGASSSFEFAVSAAASIGVHMAHEGLDGQLVTDAGPIGSTGMFEDVLLDALSVIKPSNGGNLTRGVNSLRGGQSGLMIVVAGRLTAAEARLLAAARHDSRGGIAVLLDVSSWADTAFKDAGNGKADGNGKASGKGGGNGKASGKGGGNGKASGKGGGNGKASGKGGGSGSGSGRAVHPDETAPAASVLRGAGWRVVTIDASTPLADAWLRLPRSGGLGQVTDTRWMPEEAI
jgi:uncharacterized protein (DUF58 family)